MLVDLYAARTSIISGQLGLPVNPVDGRAGVEQERSVVDAQDQVEHEAAVAKRCELFREQRRSKAESA